MLRPLIAGILSATLFTRIFRRLPAGRHCAGAAAAILLAGCAVGPDHLPPDPTPAAFHLTEGAGLGTEPFEARWWAQFGDPVLDDLIERALANHLDLRIAAARVDEARALLAEQRRERWPAGQAGAGYDRRRAQQPAFGDQRIDVSTYDTGFAPFWELDLFGRLRRGAEAAAADAQAVEADMRDAQVLVAAEVAQTYLELRGAQKRLRVAQSSLENQRETLRLTQVRLELGRGNELDVASAAASLAATQAGIPPLVAAERIAAHRLAVLLGLPPGALDTALDYVELPPQLTTLAVGQPAELLHRRPDVAAAERRLAAATARIGVARAERLPRVSVSGFIGFVTGDASSLGESASRAWSLTPLLSWAALDLGGVGARVDAAEARADAALAAYQRAVLRALEETNNTFVTYTQRRRRLEAVTEQVSASRRAAYIARLQYREGALDFLRLLDAERTVLEAEDAAATAETELNAAVVSIYKALGGGWEAADG